MTPNQLRRFLPKLRFEERDEDLGECWIWTAAKTPLGYGKLGEGGHSGRTLAAHRLSFEHFVGSIADGLQIDHLCRVKACVNPRHLQSVAAAVNVQRGFSPMHMAAVGRSWKGKARTYTADHLAKMRAVLARCHAARRGQSRGPHSEATKAKISMSKRGKPNNQVWTPERRARCGERSRAYWAARREKVA